MQLCSLRIRKFAKKIVEQMMNVKYLDDFADKLIALSCQQDTQEQRRLDTQIKNYQKQVNTAIVAHPQPIQRKHSQQSINFQLTQKLKNQTSLINTHQKTDSFMYSNFTLNYSKTGFGLQNINLPQRSQSQKTQIDKVDTKQQKKDEIIAKISRVVSRQGKKIVVTQRSVKSKRQSRDSRDSKQSQGCQSNSSANGVFQTQVIDYKNKLSKIRLAKQQQKARLQMQLRRLNGDLKLIQKHQKNTHKHQSKSVQPQNTYQSRLKHSINPTLNLRAKQLVNNIKKQKKKNKVAAFLQLQNLDRNINGYMQQIVRQAEADRQRRRQIKKMGVVERMKNKEMRKLDEERKREENMDFLQGLRKIERKVVSRGNSQRRNCQAQAGEVRPIKPKKQQQLTPELFKKKSELKRVRGLKFTKQMADTYQQLIM